MKISKGQPVSLATDSVASGEIHGITIEDVSSSPTQRNPDRTVVRVRWEDGSETIENTDDLL